MLISHGINDVKRGLGNKEICTHDIKTQKCQIQRKTGACNVCNQLKTRHLKKFTSD